MTKKKVQPPEIEPDDNDKIAIPAEGPEVETSPAIPGPNLALIEEAVADGAVLIGQGKSKIEAAMAIYAKLETESQEVVIEAFIKGASLTPKGALTYWYNCRRKLRKQRMRDGS